MKKTTENSEIFNRISLLKRLSNNVYLENTRLIPNNARRCVFRLSKLALHEKQTHNTSSTKEYGLSTHAYTLAHATFLKTTTNIPSSHSRSQTLTTVLYH